MTRCLYCGANGTNLSLIPVIKNPMNSTPTFTAWEMSTYGGTLEYLRKNVEVVIESEFFPGHPRGQPVDGVLNEDVQKVSFKDSSIDLITSNQVLEHVPDDIRGYAECYRVLRKNGALIFSVPLYDIPQTRMLAALIDGRVHFYCEPEYHDSRAGGPKSVLTFWHHSIHDIATRVSRAGFKVNLIDVMISSSQKVPAKVIYAVKV
jgi:SAM-dependent methyltransferase